MDGRARSQEKSDATLSSATNILIPTLVTKVMKLV